MAENALRPGKRREMAIQRFLVEGRVRFQGRVRYRDMTFGAYKGKKTFRQRWRRLTWGYNCSAWSSWREPA